MSISKSKLLVIFDLNGTLMHRGRGKKDDFSIDIPDSAISVGSVKGRAVYLRPGVEDVLSSNSFMYSFWTSAKLENAIAMTDLLPKNAPEFIWDRSLCTDNPNGEKSWSVFKDLELIDKIKYPRFVLVDDTDEKLYRHHKKHHLHIPQYLFDKNDNVLKHLRVYLDLLADMEDYIKFMTNLNFDAYLQLVSTGSEEELKRAITEMTC
eukprot:NODE_369_length_9975_cov_0.256582.p6 type:complete len:207 gc:universal NODE_369_length_9975_cov_0.256582:7042-6422(-)